MLPEQRKRRIVGLVTEHDGCSVTELAEALGVSKATVRRGGDPEKGLFRRLKRLFS